MTRVPIRGCLAQGSASRSQLRALIHIKVHTCTHICTDQHKRVRTCIHIYTHVYAQDHCRKHSGSQRTEAAARQGRTRAGCRMASCGVKARCSTTMEACMRVYHCLCMCLCVKCRWHVLQSRCSVTAKCMHVEDFPMYGMDETQRHQHAHVAGTLLYDEQCVNQIVGRER